ncbi:MAG: NAD(P)H-hydrate dehydratase [Paramuribaculum sp.]|nr:NAD(P)H-hydrate dehydratase [Paramuribaculum sp.]
MKIFTNENIQLIDRITIEKEGVSALDLVERVADGVMSELVLRWRTTRTTLVFAGPGNNGADALAVSRRLYEQGFRPEVFLFNIGGNRLSSECRRSRDIMLASCPDIAFHEISTNLIFPEITSSTQVLDGLFGSGLRDSISGGFRELVRMINDSGAYVVSIDMPSGLFADWNPNLVARDVIHARLTVCVQLPRVAYFLADNAPLVGEWKCINIGLSSTAIQATSTPYHLVESSEVRRLLRVRPEFCSKADFGSACLVAGRYGMIGAAVLACRGAMRSGVGKVTLHSPQCAFEVIQSAVPEVLFSPDKDRLMLSEVALDHDYKAIAVGPGIGTHDTTIKALDTFLKSASQPLVLDADALNCIALSPSMLNHLPVLSVLTPHAGEFDRLFGEQHSAETRLLKALEVSRYYNILILLKGRYTSLVRPDGKVYFNSSGTPAMATAGSGDVLTGLIAGLMAQGYKPEVAALIGAYIHGRAGELAAEEHGEYGVTAGDIAFNIGKAIKQIMNQ